uniref:Uncharacterized protein n=1 Tax=Parascaris equorum TaxID=6256 RepID=A0A914S771_PAREQ
VASGFRDIRSRKFLFQRIDSYYIILELFASGFRQNNILGGRLGLTPWFDRFARSPWCAA